LGSNSRLSENYSGMEQRSMSLTTKHHSNSHHRIQSLSLINSNFSNPNPNIKSGKLPADPEISKGEPKAISSKFGVTFGGENGFNPKSFKHRSVRENKESPKR
jgi:hypothetical protein